MATIWKRGPYRFCVRIRRNNVSETKTFATRAEAAEWARFIEGKVSGEEEIDLHKAHDITLR